MKMDPKDTILRPRPPVYEIPPFEFETVIVDLQSIYSGDVMKDADEAKKLVESFVSIQSAKAKAKRKVIAAFYPNLHHHIKICFLTFVLLDRDKIDVKERPVPVFVPPV